MTSLPIVFEWTGTAMEPTRRFRAECDREFVIGEKYRLAASEIHSDKDRNHYFATLKEVWESLPDEETARFPTEEHLRKYALVMTGFRDERTFVCSSKSQAVDMAAFMKPLDRFAVIVVRDAVVRVWTAQSQKKKAMGAKEFHRSKQAVLEFVATLIGVDASELPKEEAA